MSSAARKLQRYRSMRDFSLTEEPSGGAASRTGHSFVVQKHDATRLHYDFRLELDGVLKSWAIPKGPSLSPKDKRLAVMTEDHPMDYRDFEGTIPEGEYGGGPVIVWDRGDWTAIGDPREGLRKGRLEFTLDGEKLHGRFMLVRLASRSEQDDRRSARSAADERKKKDNWILMKRGDEHVREGKRAEIVSLLPRSVLTGRTVEEVDAGVPATNGKVRRAVKMPAFGSVEPELATLVDDVPRQGDWVHEIKYDGYRILAYKDGARVRLASRNGKDWTDHFPEIAEALAHVRCKTAVLDGEVAWVLEDGRTDFQSLQNALKGSDRSRLLYFAFDCVHLDGVDLAGEPLAFRKDKLRTILAGEGPPLRLGDHVAGDGVPVFEQACAMGLEGIVCKRASSPYVGKRTRDWVKVKCQKRQEMVIVGFTPPKGSRSGLGALLLAVHDGGRYRYAGKVGTGFSNASLAELRKKLAPLVTSEPSAEGAPRMRSATWVKPELVCQVRFTEWTREGSLRHPTFEGLREDKRATQVRREVEKPVEEAEPKPKLGRVAITHPDRVVDAKTGLTKADLARYHEAVASRLLPFAAKRPLMLLRCPEGHASKKTCFVQKHSGRGLVKNVSKSEVLGEEVLFVTKPDEVFELVQLNVVELHGWGSRMPKWDRPDWVVFDFDPDESVAFDRVVEGALTLREELRRLGLESFVKTTGGKGLHVVVPVKPVHDWETIEAFAELVAAGMVKRAPREYVMTMSKAARKGKIFLDRFRNAKGATAVLPYSPRAREGLPVAMPVAWNELAKIDPQDFTVVTVPKLLARRRRDRDPWEDALAIDQRLSKRVLDAL